MVTPASPLVRNDYAAGDRLAAADFARDQDYHRAIQAWRCRALHTPGIAFGLEVALVADRPQLVEVASGMAIDSAGQQILLARATTVDLSATTASELYLTITAFESLDSWTIAPQGEGFARIHQSARLALRPDLPLPGGAELVLARLSFTPDRRLRPPDLAARTVCGLQAGHLALPPPDGATPAPLLAMAPDERTLLLDTPLTDLFGALRVGHALTVGPASRPDSCLAVQTPKPAPGAGRISSKGVYILGSDAYDLAALAPGDQLIVPADDGGHPGDRSRYTVVSVAERTVTVATAPDPPLDGATYAIARGNVLGIRPQPLSLALAVSTQGQVGVGGPADGGAALTVRDGSLLLEDRASIRFAADGTVTSHPPARTIRLLASAKLLEVRDPGSIAFDVTGAPSPGLSLTRDGKVGIGTGAPPQPLSVDGIIRADGGVIFPDGSHQGAGVIAIPIGTVVTWWRPEGATAFIGAGFQLCDGSTITDAASPLVGLKTPNLNGAFMRGAVNYEEVGQAGGSLTHTHDFTLPGHTHPMPHIHPVSGNTTSLSGTAGADWIGSSISTSDHTHTINGDTGMANPDTTSLSSTLNATATAPASSMPPHMSLLCAIRVR